MSTTFGEFRTVPASDRAKEIMRQLVNKGLFKEQRDIWTLGASLGIALGKTEKRDSKTGTFQNINSLDPEGIFGAVMLGLYPNRHPDDRLNILVDHAEWGIRQIFEREQNGTLDFSKLGLKQMENIEKRSKSGE
jgi:hypothetical protein